jgi:exonuclease SbcC
MITRIILRNFQKHEHLVLDLDPVTTLVGSTDQGKSSVLRALRWVALNKPRGLEFIRHGTKGVSVTAFAEDDKVRRARSKEENTYSLNGKKYGALGSEVPRDVSSVLSLDDTNFQLQFDPPFWFNLSPPEVSRQLNNVVDLSVIDSTMSSIAGDTRKAKAEYEVVSTRYNTLLEERNGLRWIKDAHEDLTRVEGLEKRGESLTKRVGSLEEVLKRTDNLQGTLRGVQKASQEATSALRLGQAWKLLSEDTERLEGLIRDTQEALHNTQVEIPDISHLEHLASLMKLLRSAVVVCEAVQDYKAEAITTKKLLEEEMGDTCMLCGRSLP